MGIANYNIDLSGEWKFHLGALPKKERLTNNDYHLMAEAGGALHEYDFERAEFETITVPHDWLTSLPYDSSESAMNGYKARGEAYYMRTLTLSDEKIESARIIFDGILGISTVYVNGTVAVRNFSGYNRFSAEIGDYLLPGEENTIIIHVNATRGEGWFYEGAGLYRGVYIEMREYTHIESDEVFVRTIEADGEWKLICDLGISGEETEPLTVTACLRDRNGKIINKDCKAIKNTLSLSLDCPSAELWSPLSPYLYLFSCELKRGEEIIDSYSASVGFRKIELSTTEGMLLNGKPLRVKGICCHQDHAGVGAALTPEIYEYRVKKLKSLGVNAYRTAHNAPSEELLDICDRLGMLVMVENRTFSVSDDAMRELASMVKVARNHPSVFLYSLFNEEPWQCDERGMRIAKRLREKLRSLDSTRAVTAAQNSGILEKNNASDALDIIGVNYNLKNYEECHKRTPDKLILGTENCPTFATRGIYKTDKDDRVFSSYGDDYASWFSESIDETMEAVEKYPYVIGCFAWCGFEHRGEPVPYAWPSVTSHWGFTDSCGFEKDTAYLLKAYYTDELCVHLLPHWNFNESETVRVEAFTNAEEAELFLNGKSLGKVAVSRRRARWLVPYERGTLSVKATRNKDTVTAKTCTANTAKNFIIEDVTPKASKQQCRIINVKIVDENETLVYNFCKNIDFSLEGGKLLGVGNGNPNSHHSERAGSIAAFMGRLQIILSADVKSITLSSGSLRGKHTFE